MTIEQAKEEKKALVAFEKRTAVALRTLSEITMQRKALEEQEADIKKAIITQMEKYGVKSFKNDAITISYVDENPGKVTLDTTAFQNAEPELFEELLKDYPKITGKKAAYVRFSV